MKVLVLSIFCGVVSVVSGGSAAWSGAPLAYPTSIFKTIIPAQTKGFAYSTTQYINALPYSYSLGLPQYSYQIPQYNPFAALQNIQQTYIPVSSPTYFPASSVIYPSANPVTFGKPEQSEPSNFPEQSGDADTAVIPSADFPLEQNQQISQQPEKPAQFPPANAPQFSPTSDAQFPPASTFPQFPQASESGNAPSFPGISQGSGQIPAFPQFPQVGQLPGFPQIPGFFPSTTPAPGFSEQPGNPPSSFPSPGSSGDKGLNDEDTISVESA